MQTTHGFFNWELTRSLDGINEFELINLEKILMNVKVWLSGAITYQDTCLDGFENTTSEAGKKLKDLLMIGMHKSSNALAIVIELTDSITNWNATKLLGRRLLQGSKSPSWVDQSWWWRDILKVCREGGGEGWF